jgi:uncharacterized protein (UPF0332 family)
MPNVGERIKREPSALINEGLKSHSSRVSVNHNIKITKKNPTISGFNDELKNNGIYDVPIWRFIQRLRDIRNLCVHTKDREPTKDEVDELIKGAQQVIKTLF